mmetsp:Transcript_2484/g.7930  ORF Transcript_2484/g.7930 Transcript_2484/m.7930 type:complete len:292 (+) Transcript_2484:58-933(+)
MPLRQPRPRRATRPRMLGAMFGTCSVVMAGAPCSVEAKRPQAFAGSDTEREAELPLLGHGGVFPGANHVQDLGSLAVDAERVDPPGIGGAGREREFEALATAPVELSAQLPANYRQGRPVQMRGPHGPVEVIPPEDVQPGAQMTYRLAPPPEFRVEVPPGCGPGAQVQFERSDGVEVCVKVPPGVHAGDVFEVTPPSLMVRVPEGAVAGDRVVFRHSIGAGRGGREESEWCRAQVPRGVRPGAYFAARLPAPTAPKAAAEKVQERAPCPKGDLMGVGPCTSVEKAEKADEL